MRGDADELRLALKEQGELSRRAERIHRETIDRAIRRGIPAVDIAREYHADHHHVLARARQLGVRLPKPTEHFGLVPA